MRRHHSELMVELLPRINVDLAEPLKNCGPRRWLEIGFGGGEHLAHVASLNPDVTMMGAEAFQNGVAKALAHVEEKALTNVRFYYGDARALLAALPDQCCERIYLLYPDPWPKARQKRRRFVNAENLRQIHRILQPDGHFYFASDIADYVDWTREHVAATGGFACAIDRPEPFDTWTVTRFEAKAKREGRESRYLCWRKLFMTI